MPLRAFSLLRALAVVLPGALLAAPVAADTLDLRGSMRDGRGQPMAGQSFRLVLGSDPSPRAAGAGRVLRTDAQGRFALRSAVGLQSRRIRLDNLFTRHDSQLLEIGFEFDLLGQPALYWVEIDFTRFGPLRGIEALVPGPSGAFDRPLTFHSRNHSWSIPGDPRGLMLTGIGADVTVSDWRAEGDGTWYLELDVTRQQFEMR